ncbi:MAG: hypothetical protein ACR2KK_07785 [Acidimicrobiales bacterium]
MTDEPWVDAVDGFTARCPRRRAASPNIRPCSTPASTCGSGPTRWAGLGPPSAACWPTTASAPRTTRLARVLLRWRERTGATPERTLAAFVRRTNRRLYGLPAERGDFS